MESMDELRKRYKDELRAMNHVPEDLADTSDFDSCSAMDCTGLIPALPLSEAELESYEDLYPFSLNLQRNRGRCRSAENFSACFTASPLAFSGSFLLY